MFNAAVCFLAAILTLALPPLSPVQAGETPLISKEELRSMLDDPGLAIIDVRPDDQWQLSSSKLPGASHEDPFTAEQWGQKYTQAETIVLYCA